MDADNLRVGLQLVNMLGTFGIGCWLYLERRNDKTNDRITELSTKVDHLDKAVSSLQASSALSPSHNDLSRVYDAINTSSATVNRLVGEVSSIKENVRLILNRMTHKGGGQ